MSAKQGQDFCQRAIAAACDADLNGSFQFLPLPGQNAHVGEIVGFASAMALQIARAEQVRVHGVAKLGHGLVQADFQRALPQLVVPARQHRIEGGPFWQVGVLQAFAEKILNT